MTLWLDMLSVGIQHQIAMTSLTNLVSRQGAIIHHGYAVCTIYQGYNHASNSAVSNAQTDPNNTIKESHDESLRNNSRNTEKFSEGPDLSDFIAGVVPRYIHFRVK